MNNGLIRPLSYKKKPRPLNTQMADSEMKRTTGKNNKEEEMELEEEGAEEGEEEEEGEEGEEEE